LNILYFYYLLGWYYWWWYNIKLSYYRRAFKTSRPLCFGGSSPKISYRRVWNGKEKSTRSMYCGFFFGKSFILCLLFYNSF